MHKDQIRTLVARLEPGDRRSLILSLEVLRDMDPKRPIDRRHPLIVGFAPNIAVMSDICAGRIPMPRVSIDVANLSGQKFNIITSEMSATALSACDVLGTPPAYYINSSILCIPNEHRLKADGDSWALYRGPLYLYSFFNDDIAAAMLRLGVREAH